MAQEYEVLQFKKGDFQDNYGNYWCDMALKGVGEPVRIAVKDPTQFQDGMTLYGSVETKTSKAGKEYLKFKREEREEDPDQQTDKPKQSDEYWEDKNLAIKAQWAIGQAIKLQTAFSQQKNDPASLRSSEVEDTAKYLFKMVARVKATNVGDSESTDPKAQILMASEQRDNSTSQLSDVGDDAEAASLYASIVAQEN